jgi:hypothetical protein
VLVEGSGEGVGHSNHFKNKKRPAHQVST